MNLEFLQKPEELILNELYFYKVSDELFLSGLANGSNGNYNIKNNQYVKYIGYTEKKDKYKFIHYDGTIINVKSILLFEPQCADPKYGILIHKDTDLTYKQRKAILLKFIS